MDATLEAARARLTDAASSQPPGELAKAAQEFEAFILKMLLQEMRKSVQEDGLFQDRSVRGYQALLDDALTQRAAEAGTFGLAKQLIRELESKK